MGQAASCAVMVKTTLQVFFVLSIVVTAAYLLWPVDGVKAR